MAKRIVFFPQPLPGHISPMLELASIFHGNGFKISIIYIVYSTVYPSKHPEFTFHPVSRGVSEALAILKEKKDHLSNNLSTNDLCSLNLMLNNVFVEPFRECLSRIISDAADSCEQVTCLISDILWYSTQAVADSFKLPRIALQTSNISSLLALLPYQQIREHGYFSSRDLLPDGFKGKFLSAYRDSGEQSSQAELISILVRESKSSKGLIVNSFTEIEDSCLAITQKELPIPIFPCGPFQKWLPSPSSSITNPDHEDQSYFPWLDAQVPNSVLFVSLGTVVSIEEATFLELAWGIANSKQPFLFVVRSDLLRASDGSSHLPDSFMQEVSERGKVVSWVQQKKVLAHPAIGAFLTHSGWNSTLESICEGVPLICFPVNLDQMLNATYVSDVWRNGLHLGKETKRDEMEKAIRKVMVEEEGRKMRERAACLKMEADKCFLPVGSSYKYMQSLMNLISSL